MDYTKKLKRFYNIVLAQTLSASGKYLFAGTMFGDIFLMDIVELDKSDLPRSKLKVFPQGANNEVHCLAFHRDFLIVGTIGVIYGLKWNEEKQALGAKSWEIRIPLDVNAVEVPDVNFMWMRPGTDTLYAGCGDNIVYQISLEDGRIERDYRGHTDYVHGVSGCPDGRMYSASEDGTVRFWSDKEKEATNFIEPGTCSQLMRPEFGKWIGAVAASGDWLICGGGPKFSIWHLHSLECVRDFPFPGKIHACDFIEDKVLVAGEHECAQIYDINGNSHANLPVDLTAVYSVTWQLEPIKFMSIAGYSNHLHVLNDFRFVDSKIDMYGNEEESVQKPERDRLYSTY